MTIRAGTVVILHFYGTLESFTNKIKFFFFPARKISEEEKTLTHE